MRAEILETVNSLHTEEPLRIPLPYSDNSPMLCPGANFEFSLQLHVDSVGEQDLCLLFVYREACVSRMVLNGFLPCFLLQDGSELFQATQLRRHFTVYTLLEATTTAQPSHSSDHLFLLNLEVWNISPSTVVDLTQITCLSPTWECDSITTDAL